jgi:AcrR family transcriptional regulator
MPTSSPTRQRRKEARPQELLDAALAVFVERGFAAARTDDVAQRAGVSKGTLYLYYPSKNELLKAVITHSLADEIAAGARTVAAHTGSAADLLRNFVVPWWQQVYDSPASGVFKLMITEVRNFDDVAEFYAREVMEPGEAVLRRVVEIGVESGEFQAIDVDHAVHSLLLPMVMLCVHKHSLGACAAHFDFDARRFIASHVELLLSGLLAPGRRVDAGEPMKKVEAA